VIAIVAVLLVMLAIGLAIRPDSGRTTNGAPSPRGSENGEHAVALER
jgi:hypothetical protein